MGRPVELRSERVKHIRQGHKEFPLDSLQTCISSPTYIQEDVHDIDTNVYSVKGLHSDFPHLFGKVVVKFDITDKGSIVTAHLTSDLPVTRIIWMPKGQLK